MSCKTKFSLFSSVLTNQDFFSNMTLLLKHYRMPRKLDYGHQGLYDILKFYVALRQNL